MRYTPLRDKPNDQGGTTETTETTTAKTTTEETATETSTEESTEETTDETTSAKTSGKSAGSVPEAGRVPWQTRRINQLTAQLREAQESGTATARELQVANAALEQLRKSAAAGETKTEAKAAGLLPETEIERRASAKAAEMASVKAFNDACNAVAETGKSTYKDFQTKIKNFEELGGLKPEFVQAALEAGEPHKILYALGGDLDEAARIMALSPLKQAVEMTKLLGKINAASVDNISSAPKPAKPLRGSAAPVKDLYDSKFAENDRRGWIAQREAELAAKRKAG